MERPGEFPAGAEELRRRVLANDALVIVSPQYNASIRGVLNNAIDWASRFRPQPSHERLALVMSPFPVDGGRKSRTLGA